MAKNGSNNINDNVSWISPKALWKLTDSAGSDIANSVSKILSLSGWEQNNERVNFLQENYWVTSLISWEEEHIGDRRIPLSFSSENLIGKIIPVLQNTDVSISNAKKESWKDAKILDSMDVWGTIELLEVHHKDDAKKDNKYTFRYVWNKVRIITLKHWDFEWILYQVLGVKSRLFIDWWNLELRKILGKNKKTKKK